MPGSATPRLAGVGIGLRQPHYEQALERAADLAFVEVHSENFFAEGGAALAALRRARELYDVSLHGVGLALGSAAGVDPWHLDRLARLACAIDPVRISDHACFARASRGAVGPVVHANDLLPMAFTEAALQIMVRNVNQVQERLRRPILVENLSAYLSFIDNEMSEADFLVSLCDRSGCSVLLDVNNLMVNAVNAAVSDPCAHCCASIDQFPERMIGEIHLAGYAHAEGVAIDDHGSAVRPAVWNVYAHAVRRFGAVPTLIEWDTDLPAFEVLLGEASRAATCATEAASPPVARAD